MKTFKNVLIGVILLFAFQNNALGQDAAPVTEKKGLSAHLLIGAALELGGDEVAEVYFTNGNTQSVNAGQGISVAVGGEFRLPPAEKILLRATVGYKYVTTAADNAHIRLTRVPLQFTANYMAAKKLRLGAGVVSHQNINFKADGIGQDITFKSAACPVFEISYAGVGLSYTAMTYTDQYKVDYSANAFGITFTHAISKK